MIDLSALLAQVEHPRRARPPPRLDLQQLLRQVEAPTRQRRALDLDALLASVQSQGRRAGVVDPDQIHRALPPAARSAAQQMRKVNTQINALYQTFDTATDSSRAHAAWLEILARSQRSQQILAQAAAGDGNLRLRVFQASRSPSPRVSPAARQARSMWANRAGWLFPSLSRPEAVVVATQLWSALKAWPDAKVASASRAAVRAELGQAFGFAGGSTVFPDVSFERRGGANPWLEVKSKRRTLKLQGKVLEDLALEWLRVEAHARGLE